MSYRVRALFETLDGIKGEEPIVVQDPQYPPREYRRVCHIPIQVSVVPLPLEVNTSYLKTRAYRLVKIDAWWNWPECLYYREIE